jgi:16S rRNA (cytidine1402-2'-O)-methyltransferase
MENKGRVYLIPTTLGDTEPLEVLPLSVKKHIERITHFIVENEKSARRFIKRISPKKPQASLTIYLLDKYTEDFETRNYLDVCMQGEDVGVLSEAGVPGIADPGAVIVKLAHQLKIQVVPLVGPSSILMAMMASGLNGQNFAFNGYLPIDDLDRKRAIKSLEKKSKELNQSQIFIETPYRNMKMFESLLKSLTPLTQLCVAADISLATEYIRTASISSWKGMKPDLHKRPCIFIIQKP